MIYHLTLIRMATIEKSTNNAGEHVEKKEPSDTVGGNVNWWNHYGKQYEFTLKTKNRANI